MRNFSENVLKNYIYKYIMNYSCEECEFVTRNRTDYNRHIISKKHLQLINSKQKNLGDVDKNYKVIELYKKMLDDKEKVMNEIIENKDKMMKDLMNEKDKTIQYLDSEIKTLTNIINGAGTLSNQSMSIVNYLIKNHSDAPPLLTFTNCSKIKIKDNYTDQLIYFYRNNILIKHIVECIVSEYKKEDPAEQSLWTSDTSRLTYIIKEIMKDNTSNWMVDKQGIKMGKYIIDPLLKFIRIDIMSHLNTSTVDIYKLKPHELEEHTLNLQAASHIVSDIDKGILKKDITRELAPQFYMNRKAIR